VENNGMKQDEEFNGFISPSGKLITLTDVDRMFAYLGGRTEDRNQIVKALWRLAEECSDVGASCAYYEKILLLVDTPAEKAECLLEMNTESRDLSITAHADGESVAV
jgi:hypothetical protein